MKKRAHIPELVSLPSPDENPFEGDRQFVSALWRGLEILRAFRPRDDGLTNLELSDRTGLGPSTVSRLTYTLTRLGYVSYDPRHGTYRLGVPVLTLGYACLSGMAIREKAQPLLQRLADHVGEGHLVALSTRDMLRMTYVACARAEGVMSMNLDIGSHVSLPRSSAGWAWLSGAAPTERDAVIAAAETDSGEDWPQVRTLITDGMASVAEHGFCLNMGHWRREVHVAAVPLPVLGKGGPRFSLTCGGPSFLLPRERLEDEIAPRLMNIAAQIAGRSD